MVKGILSTAVISVILFSGCTATKKAEVKPEATKAEVKKEVKAETNKEVKKVEAKTKSMATKAVSSVCATAKTVPASEFFKTK